MIIHNKRDCLLILEVEGAKADAEATSVVRIASFIFLFNWEL